MTGHTTFVDQESRIKKFQLAVTKFFVSKDLIILIISLSLLSVGATFLFKSAFEWVNWKYDDAENLSIAYNLFHGKGLTKSYIDLEANTVAKNIPVLKIYDQISNPLRGKGPLYYVFLGGWLTITDANSSNWYFWGSIFNFSLVASSIVTFYFFTKRYFGNEIAAYATPVLALMPGLLWFSVRIRPDVLAFVFIMMSLYFAGRKTTVQNLVITGVFCALAHLTHPLGILPGSAFLIYLLLFKRKFKGALIFMTTWILALSPWIVRNYIVFGDATRGLGLPPIPGSISTALGLVSPSSINLDAAKLAVANSASVLPFDTLREMLKDLTTVYGMQLFIVFVSFSIIAYLSLPSIRRVLSTRKNVPLVLGWVFVYSALILRAVFYQNGGLFVQVFLLFGAPILGYLYLRIRHKNVFTTNGDIYTILAIFTSISFLSYFMYGIAASRIDVEPRIILYSLYVFIPIAVIGIKKLLTTVYSYITSPPRKDVIRLSLISILVIFSLVQTSTGIVLINIFQTARAEHDDQKSMNRWITENIPIDAKIASELPHVVLLRTGHEAVNFQHVYKDNISYERWIIKKFDIDYLVFYYPKNRQGESLSVTDLGEIELKMVYHSAKDSIYKVVNK